MNKQCCDIAVIGGGPAGMAAALAACENGAGEVTIIERDYDLGGILPQCVHDGFGLLLMKERLTGPEYAEIFKDRVQVAGISCRLDTMVLEVSPPAATGEDFVITVVNSRDGVCELSARAVILAMGCRERTRAQVMIPGSRPAGIFTAGTAQRLVNIDGVLPGTRAVILGSGDIGLIMARRLTLEGVIVEGVYEILAQPSGLTRNVVQCLEDYNIPLHLSHTITEIHGNQRVEAVTVAQVDEKRQPIAGTEYKVACDTVILSVGLIPENELSEKAGVVIDECTGGPRLDAHMQTSIPGLFACGNVVNVYDLVDYVTMSAQVAGKGAADYIKSPGMNKTGLIPVKAGENVHFVVPQLIEKEIPASELTLYLRVQSTARDVRVKVRAGKKLLASKRFKIVKPPEMVTINLKPQDLRELMDAIVVEVVPAGSGKGGK